MRNFVTLTALGLLLAACGPAENEPGPGGVSVGEAKALDEAAEMIEARRLPLDALPQSAESDVPLPPQAPQDQEGASE